MEFLLVPPNPGTDKLSVIARLSLIKWKDMNTIIKSERAKIEKFRERDHQHYQESVDELHTHYKDWTDIILKFNN